MLCVAVASPIVTGGTYVECHAVDAPPPPPATPYSLLQAINSEDEMRALLNLVKQGEHTAYAPQGDGEVFRCVLWASRGCVSAGLSANGHSKRACIEVTPASLPTAHVGN